MSPLLRLCLHAGCTRTIPITRKLCAEHARADSAKRNQRTKRDGRNTADWQRTRSTVIARAHGYCELQLPGCTTIATTAHKQGGGLHTPTADYQAACARCHGKVDGQRGQAQGAIIG